MKDDISDVSAGAGAMVAIEIGHSIINVLIDEKITTEGKMAELLSAAAERQTQLGDEVNREAARVLDEMRRALGGKFGLGMPRMRPGA
jgi:hypothetical protein